LTAGHGVLLSAREGFTMTHAGPVQFLGVKLSRVLLSGYVHNADAAVMRPVRGSALEWLARYLGAILVEPVPDNPLISRHVYDIVGAALAPARGQDGVGIRAARLQAIRSHILEHLDSPRLTVASVAARQRITTRYVHKLFELDGTTYSSFVLEQRLSRVYRQLTDPRFAGRTISALAFDAGFGDLSYFNRAFKRRYGATPSDVRAPSIPHP
jgi:AraC-like DNA-binding protein